MSVSKIIVQCPWLLTKSRVCGRRASTLEGCVTDSWYQYANRYVIGPCCDVYNKDTTNVKKLCKYVNYSCKNSRALFVITRTRMKVVATSPFDIAETRKKKREET